MSHAIIFGNWSITQAFCRPVRQSIWFVDDSHENMRPKNFFISRKSGPLSELR